jgi:hypothetical protein
MAERKVTNILDGPDREALFESFENHYMKRRGISFLLINGVIVVGSIYELAYEDGSGKHFMFKMNDYSGGCYEGYYDTVSTTGWIAAVTN